MSRNVMGVLIVVLAVAGGALGYMLWQERQQNDSVEISVGEGGVKIESK